MKIRFKCSQIIQTMHPLFEVTVEFMVSAYVVGDEVQINSITASPVIVGECHPQPLPLPDESTIAGSRFAHILREEARKEAEKVRRISAS